MSGVWEYEHAISDILGIREEVVFILCMICLGGFSFLPGIGHQYDKSKDIFISTQRFLSILLAQGSSIREAKMVSYISRIR